MIFLLYANILLFASYCWALEVADIKDCPVPKTTERATNIHNLKVTDIEVIAAMGDSVTAGLLGRNIDTKYVQLHQFKEYRGQSFLIGGDDDANSIAAFLKHYNPNLQGSSVGEKDARLCPDTFFCLDAQHRPEIDNLNAAQSGATSRELGEQVDYLIQYLGKNTTFENKWKMINVFIGFNDVSVSCLPGRNVTDYYNNVYSNLERLLQNVDYAFVNLVGMMHYNDLVYLTLKAPGYRKYFQHNEINLLDYECYCCKLPQGGLSVLGKHVTEYNQMLEVVATRLSGSVVQGLLGPLFGGMSKNVAVVYQPMNTLIPTVPYDALSNVDGYHPNTKGYKFLARELWRQMFLPKMSKDREVPFNDSMPITCPTENDRLQTYQLLL